MEKNYDQMPEDDLRAYLTKILKDESIENMLRLPSVYAALCEHYGPIARALWMHDHPKEAAPPRGQTPAQPQ